MTFFKKWLFTMVALLFAAAVLAVNKIGEFYVLVPADKFYVDAIVAVLLIAAGILLDINIQKLAREREVERHLRETNRQLTDSIAQIRVLRGLLPICASCKKVRDDKGYWQQIEEYVRDHSEADFSHCICPECARRLYGEEAGPPDAGTAQ